MRIKVETISPLESVKAWFSLTSSKTILDLKNNLCASLPPLQDVEAQNISLLLDEFELLDNSGVDVIREGELICIQRKTISISSKRKAVSHESSPPKKKVKRLEPVTPPKNKKRAPSVTSSDTTSESDSSVDSTTDSNTDSESSSPDDDSSSDDSSSAPESIQNAHFLSTQRPQAKMQNKASTKKAGNPAAASVVQAAPKSVSAAPLVPPGLGKPTTHNRNIRRRRKRMAGRFKELVEPVGANATPLGTQSTSKGVGEAAVSSADFIHGIAHEFSTPPETSHTRVPAVFMMSTLQNKNKKKGFKSMMSNLAPKIIFDSPEGRGVPGQAEKTEDVTEEGHSSQQQTATFPRLVPPSDKQENGTLPSNMFVTSVDVEEGLRSRKKKRKTEDAWDHVEPENEIQELSYSLTVEDPTPIPQSNSGLDWSVVEARWDTLPQIKDASQLKPGLLVGWMELAINPGTFTPEMLLNVARVIACGESLTVEPLLRPGAAQVSFGGLVEEEQLGEEEYEWTEVLNGDWRTVDAGI